MSAVRHGGERMLVAIEAARVMYEEGVKQYFTAKRIAARRILGRTEAKASRFRPGALPSNGEIREALLLLAANAEGAHREHRLFVLRLVALRAMRAMEAFAPRLIGSVSTGHVRKGSDVDVQLFTEDFDAAERVARGLDPRVERERVTIRKGGELREYTHLHAQVAPREGAELYAVEFTVYPYEDLRYRPRSSTDGKPIHRMKLTRVAALVETEHAALYARFLANGSLPPVEEDDTEHGPYDALVSDLEAQLDDDEACDEDMLPTSEELAMLDDEAEYDPLPGFESL